MMCVSAPRSMYTRVCYMRLMYWLRRVFVALSKLTRTISTPSFSRSHSVTPQERLTVPPSGGVDRLTDFQKVICMCTCLGEGLSHERPVQGPFGVWGVREVGSLACGSYQWTILYYWKTGFYMFFRSYLLWDKRVFWDLGLFLMDDGTWSNVYVLVLLYQGLRRVAVSVCVGSTVPGPKEGGSQCMCWFYCTRA